MRDLLDHVEFTEPCTLRGFIGQGTQTGVVLFPHILHVSQPIIGQTHVVAAERSTHAAAAIVTYDHDMFHFQHIDRELNYAKAVQVGVHHDVGHIAMHEKLAGQQTDNLIGRDATVRASNPQVFGRLLSREFFKKFRIASADIVRPGLVLIEQVTKRSHGGSDVLRPSKNVDFEYRYANGRKKDAFMVDELRFNTSEP